MSVSRLLRRATALAGGRVAVCSGTSPLWTFRELDERASRLATTMTKEMGLAPGERAIIFASNSPQYVECLFGCWYAGLTVVPINERLHTRELAYIMHDTEARLCFTSTAQRERALAAAASVQPPAQVIDFGSTEFERMHRSAPQGARPEPAWDALAWLFYTSGTTGRPKGAMLTHANLMAMTASYLADVDRVEPGDALVHAAPMSHGSGLYILPYVAALGIQVVPPSGGFEAAETWELLQTHPRSAMFAAPTLLNRLVGHKSAHAVSTESLKTIVVGGAPFYAEDARRAVASLGSKITQIYGQGESPMTICVLPQRVYAETDHPEYEPRIASVGWPHSVVDIRVVNDKGEQCPRGQVGELVVKGATVMKGYWRNPESTAAALKDGWLHTGDLAAAHADGYITLKGRSKELIISGGSNIYPREIEDVLLMHPDVAAAAVVGEPHPDWGEEVVAFVVPASGGTVSSTALDAWCLQHIARFKRPKRYRIVDGLPMNGYGKVMKSALVETLAHEHNTES